MKKLIALMILGVSFYSCNNVKTEELNQVKQERDSLMSLLQQNKKNENHQIASFLTFQNADAEEAMNFYVNLFDHSKVVELQRYQKGEYGTEGTIKYAKFILNGSPFMCSDSYIKHDWDFSPAVSIFVDFNTEEKLLEAFEKLSEGGKIFMPLDNYGFSKKFGFVEDKYGVSWQLNLQ